MTSANPHDQGTVATCGARTRAGTPCTETRVMANGRCYRHGGATPTGPALPQYKTGRYSKHLPDRLLARYQESEDDPNRLALEAELALVDARLVDVLRRVDTGESGRIWQRLQDAGEAFREARRNNDPTAQGEALSTILRLIGQGHSDYAAWADVRALVQERRRIAESERKRLVEMQQVVAVDQVMTLASALTEAVRMHVTDARALGAITTEFRRLLDGSR
jgi:hypothetical protein